MITRRQMVKGLLAGAVVVGFDPLRGRWITAAEATACDDFQDIPALDGTLLLDDAARAAVATDQGNISHATPCAVLRAGSVEDIRVMVDYCRARGIPVAARGVGHTTHGQSLSGGLVIDNRALTRIHSIDPSGAWVDSGVTWRELTEATVREGLTPPVLTGYIKLTVGGTLSVGGVGGSIGSKDRGLQVDTVQELEVVTGRGTLETCSPDRKRGLFDALLGGLGQCGVITKARLDLMPAPDRARTYQFGYTDGDIATLFRDFRTLLARPGIGQVIMIGFPPGTSGRSLDLWATVFYDVGSPPDDLRLTGGLHTLPRVQDLSYLEYVTQVDNQVDLLEQAAAWEGLVKPWFDVWLTDTAIEPYVTEVVPTLTYRDVGFSGFLLAFAQRRDALARPYVRMPEPDGSPWVFLFDILTVSDRQAPDPLDPTFTQDMIARNNDLFARARDTYGGVRYPIGTLEFDQADWERHYGPLWKTFRNQKRHWDPAGILGPGAGIFS